MEEKDLLTNILMSPSSGKEEQVMLEEKKETEKEDTHVAYLFGKKKQDAEKYKHRIQKQIKKDPRSVKVKTPDGFMSIKEAVEKGYNPDTDRFEEKNAPKKPNMEGKDPAMAKKLQMLMDPRAVNQSPEQLREQGKNPSNYKEFSPKTKPEEPEEQPPQKEKPNPLLAALGGAN